MSFFLLFTCTISMLSFFFFNDTATTEIYTLSLHDALPIYVLFFKDARRTWIIGISKYGNKYLVGDLFTDKLASDGEQDRKSTRLNSSHQIISYAVFCLKKKNTIPATLTLSPLTVHALATSA